MHFGQHHVGLGIGEEAAALNRRQLRRIAQHQQRAIERHQVAAEFLVDHRAFVDHDQFCLRGRRIVPQFKTRLLDAEFLGAVDQRMNGRGAVAALVAHHQRRLAGEGGELHLAGDALGDVARQRGLAGAGKAEQPEHRRRAGAAGLGLQPIGDGFQRGILMRGEGGHRVSKIDRVRIGTTQSGKLSIPAVSATRPPPSAASFDDLVGPDLEADQRVGAEGLGDRHVGGVAALRDQHAADAGHVVARVESVPVPAEIGLEPAGEIADAQGCGMPMSPR